MRTNPRQWYANQTFGLFVLPLLFGNFNGAPPCPPGWGEPQSRTIILSDEKPLPLMRGFASPPLRGGRGGWIKTVVIDPGHGGKDPGCGGIFSHEKDNALAVALALGSQIEASFPQVKVIFTRETDVFIPLIDRARIANEAKADLFISIHCNSLPVRKSEIEGTEVYVLGLHVAERNLDVAKRENEAILLEKDYQRTYSSFDPDSPEGNIFFSAWQSAYMEQSIAFASFVNDAVGASGRNGRGVRQAGFMVLKETAAPSVLIETAYLTSETDENYIGTTEGQNNMAAVIFGAFSNWKSQMEGGPVAVQKQPKRTPAIQSKGEMSKKPVIVEPKKPVAQAEPVGVLPKKVVGGDAKNGHPTANNGPAAANHGHATVAVGPAFKILLTTSPKKLNPKKDPLAVVGSVEEQKINGEYRYFATGFATRTEAKKALPEIRGLGFPDAKLVD